MTEKPKAEKPKTRAELEARISELEASDKDRREVNANLREELSDTLKREKETRAQFDDLKQRLVMSEADNQRMRGYITRVQEDDVVREELIAVGDPAGEQRLVPKRKPEPFHQPSPFSVISCASEADGSARGYIDRHVRDRAPPKHWVTY